MTPAFQEWVERAKAVKVQDILRARNIKLAGRGDKLAGPCPNCGGDDRFSVHLGKQVFHCRGCGGSGGGAISLVRFLDGSDFLHAVEKITGEPPPVEDRSSSNGSKRRARPQEPVGPIVATYDYTDEAGDLLYQVTRHDPKNFRQRRPDPDNPDGGWISNIDGVRLVPYRLPDLIEAVACAQTVYIVEGEKDANTGFNLGVIATTNVMGAGKWKARGASYAEFFHEADVVIIPDNDAKELNPEPGKVRPMQGRAHANTIAKDLHEVAATVRVLLLPPGYKDLTEWVEAGGNRETLDALAEAAPEYMNGYDPGGKIEAPAQQPDADQPKIVPVVAKLEFLRGFVPPDYLIDGILQRGFVYALTGQTGHAKTAVALLLATLVSSTDPNTMLGRRKVEKGRVVYFAGENPDDVRMRVIGSDWHRTVVNSDDDVSRDTIWFVAGQFNIHDMRSYLVEQFTIIGGVNLVIVDTSAAYFLGKDEIDNVEMGAHARMLRTLTTLPGHPCIIPLCHPAKKVESQDQLLPRGGGAFLAEVDGNITLFRKPDDSIEMNYTKMRGPGFEPIVFKLEPIKPPTLKDTKDRQIPTVRAVPITMAQQEQMEKVLTDTEDKILRAYLAHPDISFRGICEQYSISSTSVISHAINDSLKPTGYMRKERGNKWMLTDKGKEEARKVANAVSRTEAAAAQGDMFKERK